MFYVPAVTIYQIWR